MGKRDENPRRYSKSGFDQQARLAQYAFSDPRRVIAKDLSHSQFEQRFYCFGQVDDGVMTVRFTCRAGIIRIIGAGY